MKTVKNLSLCIIGLVALLSGTSYATTLQGGNFSALNGSSQWFFDQTSESAPLSQAQCSEYRVEKNYYLPGDINGDGIKDENTSTYLRDNFVVEGGTYPLYLISARGGDFAGTQVRYYLPEANVLNVINGTKVMPLNNKNAWFRYSKIAPTNQWVRAIESEPMLLSAPQSGNPQNNKFQVAYNIMYRGFESKGTATNDYSTWPVTSSNDFGPLFLNSNRWALNANWTVAPRWQADYTKTANTITTASINWEKTERAHGYECFNVTTHWCGDGVVDNKTFDNVGASEQCDLGSQNGKPGSLCSATCTTILAPAIPDVSIVKSVVGNTIGYVTGDTVVYKLIVRNIGSGTATNVIVADQLPAGVTYTAGSTSFSNGTAIEPTYNATSNTLRWNMGNMPAGYYNEITFSVKLNIAPYCAPFKNDATIAPDTKDGETNTTNNNSTATFTTSCENPDVLTTKKVEAISGSYMPGQTVKYTLTYKNQGAGTANGVVVSDTLPTQVTYVVNSSLSSPDIGQPIVNGNKLTWNIGTLAPNAGGTITIYVKIGASTPVCSALKIHNDLTISATNEPNTLLENNPSWAEFYMGCVDLRSTKEVDKAVAVAGDTLTYTINYGNSGTVARPGTVTDTLPAKTEYIINSATSTPNVGQPTVNGQMLTWNVGTLQPGARGTITIKAKIPSTLAAKEEFLNKVCITDDNNFNNNNCDDAITKTNSYFDLSINKTPKERNVVIGDEFDYTLTVTNSGTVGVNGFTVKDYLPKGLEFVSASNNGTYTAATKTIVWNNLTIGAVGSFNLTVKVKYVGPISNGRETNYTEICDYNGVGAGNGQDSTKPYDTDSNPCNGTGNNEDDTSNGVIIPPTTKPYFDLSINKTPKERNVVIGDEFDYTLTVTNSGTVGVNGFTVKDYLPKGLEFVSASNNGTYTASTKTIVWNNLNIGSVGSFGLTVKVRYVGPISNGRETNYTEICDYNGVGAGNGQDTTKAHDTDSNPCNGTGNNEDDTSNGVIIPPTTKPYFDLSINKTPKERNVVIGDEFDYTLTVTNSGTVGVNGFTVKDYLPKGLEFVSASNNGTYTASTKTIVWNNLNIGSVGSFGLTVKVKYVGPISNGRETNYTEICDYNGVGAGNGQDTTKAHDTDSNPCNGTGNNEDDTSNGVIIPPTTSPYFDLSINKLVNGKKSIQAHSGDIIDFSLVVTNAGPETATNFTVKDYLPAGFVFVQASSGSKYTSNTAGDATPGTLIWTGLTLKSGETTTLTFKARYVDEVTRTNYTEICDYNGMGQDTTKSYDIDSIPCNGTGNNEDDTSNASVNPVSDYFDLSLKKGINNLEILPNVQKGTQVTVTLTVTNSGTVGVNGFSVKDYMPQDLEYIEGSTLVNPSLSNATAVYSSGNRQLLISNLTIPAKGSLTITFKAVYNGTVERTNYAEICEYNGKASVGENPKDIDSDPCNRGANPGTEDDEASAKITPYSPDGCVVNCGGSTNYYCGDGIVHRPNSKGVYEICDEGNLSNSSDPFRFGSGAVITQGALKGRFCYGPRSDYPCQVKAAPENVDAPTCGYIDPPSIQSNEYLPFWWDLESKKKGIDLDITDLLTISNCKSGYKISDDKSLAILKKSLQCEFTVKNARGVPITGFKQNCFNYDNYNSQDDLIKSAFKQTLTSIDITGSNFDTLINSGKLLPAGFDARKFGFDLSTLGEHSIDMRVSSYTACNVNSSGNLDGTSIQVTTNTMERVCQMNFVVTKPYMVSRGALGNFATDSLTSFLQFPNGSPVFTTGVPALTTNYDPGTEVSTAVNKLIADYQKIAMKADGATFKSNEGSNVTVYKVPNKEVYIFSANNDNATITVGQAGTYPNKPFTLIITKGNLVVKGNLTNSNGMFIVQNGDIRFSAENCNTQQNIGGIFISLQDITSTLGTRQSAHNIDLSKEWCNAGDITINGVLIGKNIREGDNADNSLLATRRSNANEWFNGNSDKQQYLLDHGAVVLKYNPDIFNNLPPGADTLAEILNVYKK